MVKKTLSFVTLMIFLFPAAVSGGILESGQGRTVTEKERTFIAWAQKQYSVGKDGKTYRWKNNEIKLGFLGYHSETYKKNSLVRFLLNIQSVSGFKFSFSDENPDIIIITTKFGHGELYSDLTERYTGSKDNEFDALCYSKINLDKYKKNIISGVMIVPAKKIRPGIETERLDGECFVQGLFYILGMTELDRNSLRLLRENKEIRMSPVELLSIILKDMYEDPTR